MSILRVLHELGMETQLWRAPDGSTALLLPHGGRILSLCSLASEENFFWTHPALQSVDTARAFYAGPWWHNSGGDRTWLAPEFEFFLPDYPQPEPYFQPRQLDPGNYELQDAPHEGSMVNRLSLRMYASDRMLHAKIQKTITPAANPLLATAAHSASELEYAGYTLRTTLTLEEPSTGSLPPVGLWNLLQLPHGGEMIFATYSRAVAVPYMGSISRNDLRFFDHTVRYRMRAPGELKFGIPAAYVTGRGAYLHGNANRSSLIIRNFTVNPSASYVDVPLANPQMPGCAAQACNINSSLGSFSELEYHTPAVGGPSGQSLSIDESQLWAFRGPQPAVLEAARLLVSAELS